MREKRSKEMLWQPVLFEEPKRITSLKNVNKYIRSINFTHLKRKMVEENTPQEKWNEARVNYVERQYKNWLFLRRKFQGECLPPSKDIDIFWHWHMLDTQAYFRDCAYIFGYYLHHFPYFGLRDQADQQDLLTSFNQTQNRHQEEFGNGIFDFHKKLDAKTPPVYSEKEVRKPLPNFLHINKSAGNTVRHILSLNYPAHFLNIMVRNFDNQNLHLSCPPFADKNISYAVSEIRAKQNQLKCLATNLPFGLHSYLHRDLNNFTLIREPLERCVSHWYFAYKAQGNHPLWKIIDANGGSLKRILEKQEAQQLSNYQTRLLSGASNAIIMRDDFKAAQENILRHFLIAGAVEHFDLTIHFLAKHLGWKHIRYQRKNVGSKEDKSLLQKNAKKLLMESNEWDIKLYHWLIKDYLPYKLDS